MGVRFNPFTGNLDLTGSGGGGGIESVVAGNNIDVDVTDPANPVVAVETLTLADISDVTASVAEVNVLDGIPAGLTAAELGYVDGVTSAIQTQIDGKQASGATLTSLEGLSLAQGDILYATGADTLARLPKGTASQELRMNSGATAPEWYTPSGGGSATGLEATNTRAEWQALFGSTSPSTFGFPVSVSATTTNSVTQNLGQPSTAFPAISYETSASSGQSAQVRMSANSFHRGHANYTNEAGGFRFFCKFFLHTGAANLRFFVGLTSGETTIGNVDPSSLLDMIGVGADTADTNMSIMSNDGSGTATKTDLGANFARTAYGVSYHYDLTLICPPNGNISYTFNKYTDSGDTFTATGTISSDLPSATTGLTPHCWINNGASAATVRLRIGRIFCDSRLS